MSCVQVYNCRSLSFAFIEHFILLRYIRFLEEELDTSVRPEIRAVLTDLGLLYGLWSLDAHSATLYESGYFKGPAPNHLIRDKILELCTRLKPEAVALVDAIAPPDFALNSVLGNSDGDIYKHIFDTISKGNKGGYNRPSWYREFTDHKPKIGHIKPQDPKAKL